MTPPAIALEGVGKHYWQLRERSMLLRSLLPGRGATRTPLWALRGLDLVVEPGETVGVLGRNGAGKTTLLRMLAGVSQPSEGRVTLRGRVAPLIGVGVGFHQEMSGRENVYVNGMLLGLTRAEVDRRFDEIVGFAELEAFVDTPVKFYSSGMFMRLGFAVAAHVDPRILLVDEVLAVGDIAFQLKCFERMKALKEQGTTIVIVSHSMHAIRLLCPRAVLLRHGHLELDGETEAVISRHHELLSIDGHVASATGDPGSPVEIVEQAVVDHRGAVVHHAHQGASLRFEARLRFRVETESPQVFFYVLAEDGTLAYEMKSVIGRRYQRYQPGEEATVSIPFVAHLGGGTFQFTVSITDVDGRQQLAHTASGPLVYLAPPLGSAGIADLGAHIEVDGRPASDHAPLTLDHRPTEG